MGISLAISCLAFAAVAVLAFAASWGFRRLRPLSEIEVPPEAPPLPTLCVIVAALDEAATIEPALRSLLAIDYDSLEVIAVNDRSRDETPRILERIAAGDPRLRVLHIAELPPNWLGKVHALHRAALLSRADYLLFTDADVHFEASALRRAVACCEREHLDMLALLPGLPVRGALLALLMVDGVAGLLAMYRPWRVRDSRSAFFGVGAFNLVRREAYRRAGGHEPLRMEVLDDMMLGKLMKRAGMRADARRAAELVTVEMYPSALALARGLRKNSFRVLEYRVSRLVLATAFTLLAACWPWFAPFVLEGPARWVSVAAAILSLAFHADLARAMRYSPACLLFLPVYGIGVLAMMWHASLLALWHGGIDWRGTRYPLDALRRGRL